MTQSTDPGAFFGYPATDRKRWRLKVERGRQTWVYLKTEEETVQWPQTEVERYWLSMPMPDVHRHAQAAKTPLEAAHRGFSFLSKLQTDDGHWASEYGGPMFLLPGLVIACHVCEVPLGEEVRVEMIRYLIARANADGGWGIHIEGSSTVFGTATNYAAIRLLGMPASHPVAVAARKTLHALGGAVGAPAWGKFWLSVLGVYDWNGMNPVPPELWILPYALPIHPGRMWCHTRMVYLPMGYCYGRRVTGPDSEIVQQLRKELYTEPYEDINWGSHRNNVSTADLYSPHTTIYRACNVVMRGYETVAGYAPMLRERAIRETLRQMKMEDNNTDYADLGPVNKVMNMLCMWHAYGPDSDEFKRHIPRLQDFLWLTPEGMLMNGTNGTQVWDTSFIVQCAIDARLHETSRNETTANEIRKSLSRAHDFIEKSQFVTEIPNYEDCYRYPKRGGWPFSTSDQGYSVSDTTAEAMKTIIMLQKETSLDLPQFERRRLEWAVTLLLGMQSADGGFPSYEPIRGPAWLEKFNPAEVFGDIMIEYCYPECTTAVVTGLLKFRQHFPEFKSDEISKCVQKAHSYIISAQRPEGGWFGSWAICFTYATMFALESLKSVGETWENSTNVRRACDFLLSKQNPDGGWGESYQSCEKGEYVQHPDGSQVVNTSWAVIALMYANIPVDLENGAVRRGVDLIMRRQLATGEWAQEGIEGVFNRNVAISYPNYKLAFPIWALGRYARYSDQRQSLLETCCTKPLCSEE